LHRSQFTAWLILVVCTVAVISAGHIAVAQQPVTRSQDVEVTVGDSLTVSSNRTSIQRILVEGNVSNAVLKAPSKYPADSFTISSRSPATYQLESLFNFSSDYAVNLFVQASNSSIYYVSNNSTYYISSGPFQLDVTVVFVPPPYISHVIAATASPWQSFATWLEKFGEAFPVWVKLVYLAFGFQFLAVGGLWIRRETARKEAVSQRLDTGDKAFLWVDVAYKFLLASFLAILTIMGGEVLFLFLLRFMFLASLDLLSLWDLFVICFAAGVAVIAYLVRFTLEKAFDLRPMEDD
jgi:hypothetical protein